MAKTRIKCTCSPGAAAATSVADIWAVAQDFARPWHPMVSEMRKEIGANGSVLRRFIAGGGEYLEQRSYLSHSDRVLGYRLLEGIEGLTAYEARLHLGDETVTWQAEIEAVPDRLEAIAAGTKAVFDAGLDTLCALRNTVAPRASVAPEPATQQTRRFGKNPQLAIDLSPAGMVQTDILCVYLHGIGGQRGNWAPQLAALGSLVPSVALDLRGYGDSDLGPTQTVVDDYCNDIIDLADLFKARKLILVGLSYGAWIATSFAMRHADRLAGLVLAGGCTGMSEADKAERDAFRNARQAPLDAGQTPADFAPDVVDVIAGPRAGKSIRQQLVRSMAAIPPATYRDALHCFTTPTERFDFSRISCPVLLMTGEFDRLAPPAEIREVSWHMHGSSPHSDVQFEVIADAGHLCNLEAPEAFNAHLRGFLQRVGRSRAAPVLSAKENRRLAKQQRILDAALAEFARNGFSGASLLAIAERAGVSKPTLYQYFGNKMDLLAAVLNAGKSELLAPFQEVGEAGLVQVLWDFSWTYAEFVLRPDMLSLARLIIGEAERLPDLARDYQNHGPRKALQGTISFLKSQQIRGVLQFDDAELAAQNLWSLILSAPREHCLHHPDDRPTQAQLLRYIKNGLAVFLRAYSTNVETHLGELGRISTEATGKTGKRNG